MWSWGHPLWWRVKEGEIRSQWSDTPASWALAGEGSRTADGGHRGQSLGESSSGGGLSACRQPGTIDQRHQLDRRAHRNDLVLGADAHRARGTPLLRVGKSDHRRSRDGRGGSLRDHRHIEAVPVHRFDLGIHDGDAATVAVQQTAQGRGKQPRSHRDEHFERWLR